MLTLYFTPGSSSMAPHIALHEIGVPFEAKHVAMVEGKHRTPEYLALNLEGKLPTLLIDGRPLTEVAAILYYLARRFPEADLLPTGDIEAEAQILSWMSYLASTVHPARRQGPEHASKIFTVADQRLGNRTWTVGSCSIADIHLFRLYWRFRNFPPPVIGAFPNLEAHYQRMMARPAVQKTCEIEGSIGYRLPA